MGLDNETMASPRKFDRASTRSVQYCRVCDLRQPHFRSARSGVDVVSAGSSGRHRVTAMVSRVTMERDWRSFDDQILDGILRAALSAFVDLGYHGSTLKDISQRCGLSVPGIYHHYQSKQDLLVRLVRTTQEDLQWRIEAADAEAGTDVAKRVANYVECLCLHYCYRRDTAFIGLSETRSLESPHLEQYLQSAAGLRIRSEMLLRDGAATGMFASGTELDAMAVVTLCTSIVNWYNPGRPFSPEQIAERYVDYALLMIGAQSAPR